MSDSGSLRHNDQSEEGHSVENQPFDAIVLASFGGPEGIDDIRPFLENVTRGRGIPPERLDEVGEHYKHFGGVSPLNELNRDIISRLETAVRSSEISGLDPDTPIYFANRNWHPMWADTLEQMADDGITNAIVFATSAWAGYSGCRQYDEDIALARQEVTRRGKTPPRLTKLRQFYDHPLFIKAEAQSITQALEELPAELRNEARIVFTAHSIPLSADKASGTPDDGPNLYSRQVHEAAFLAAGEAGIARDRVDVVWQSRSGPAHIPWLEPDIVDHVEKLHEQSVPAVVVSPIGFVSDHVEVVWDLDTELAEEAAQFDMQIVRAHTVGESPEFISMIVALVNELISEALPTRMGSMPSRGCSVNGLPCAENCCQPAKRPTSGQSHAAR